MDGSRLCAHALRAMGLPEAETDGVCNVGGLVGVVDVFGLCYNILQKYSVPTALENARRVTRVKRIYTLLSFIAYDSCTIHTYYTLRQSTAAQSSQGTKKGDGV